MCDKNLIYPYRLILTMVIESASTPSPTLIHANTVDFLLRRLNCNLSLTLIFVVLLSGCSSKTIDFSDQDQISHFIQQRQFLASLTDWAFRCRVVLRTPKQRHRFTLAWQRSPDAPLDSHIDRIYLYDYIGRTVFAAMADEISARVEYSSFTEQVDEAKNLEELFLLNTGYTIPVAHLPTWLMGFNLRAKHLRNQEKEMIIDEKWRIQYLSMSEFGDWVMPDEIKLVSDGVELQLDVYDWEFPNDINGAP